MARLLDILAVIGRVSTLDQLEARLE